MRNATMSLALAAIAFASGCLPAEKDSNNGLDDQLAFYPFNNVSGPLAAGAAIPVEVAHAPKYAVLCDLSAFVKGNGGCTDSVAGSTVQVNATELVAASCDGDACLITDAAPGDDGWMHFNLTGLEPGKTILHVTVKQADGQQYSDRYSLTFITPQSLAVQSSFDQGSGVQKPGDIYAAFGSRYAVFPGGHADVYPSLTGLDDQGNTVVLYGGPVSAVSAAEAVALPQVVEQYYASIEALAPGTTTVTVTVGGLSRTLPFRVADPGDIVAAELRTPVGSPQDMFDWADDPLGAGPPATSLSMYGSTTAVVVLHLRDGSLAVGGAGFLSSSAPTILDVRTFDTNSTVMPSDRDRLALPNFDYASVAVGSASISGTIAGIPLAYSVDVHP